MKVRHARQGRSRLIAMSGVAFIAVLVITFLTLRQRQLSVVLNVSCRPVCVYGVQPGNTLLTDAATRLPVGWLPWQKQVSVLGVPGHTYPLDRLESLSEGGRFDWNISLWDAVNPMISNSDHAFFELLGHPRPVIATVTVSSHNVSTSRLKDYLDLLGEPTHILPHYYTDVGLGSTHKDYVSAYLIYPDRGFMIYMQPVEKSRSTDLLRADADVRHFTSFATGAEHLIPINIGMSLPWNGMTDIADYCMQIEVLRSQC